MSTQTFPVTTEIYDRLLSFVSRRVATREEAEDLVQQLLLRLVQSDAPTDHRFAAWVFRSAKNAVIDVYRRRKREAPTSSAVEEATAPDDRDGALGADEELIAECLRQLFETLSDADQEALRSIDIEGTPQSRFAQEHGLGYVATKSRIQRARKRLRHLLELHCNVTLDARGMPVSCAPRATNCCGR